MTQAEQTNARPDGSRLPRPGSAVLHRWNQELEAAASTSRLAQSRKSSVWRYTTLFATVSAMITVPTVGGAYLGLWLDRASPAFSARWTVSLLLLGLCTGVFNAVLYVRKHAP